MTSKTRSALGTELNTNLADNTTGAITPAVMRSQLQDQIDSSVTLLDNAGQLPATATNDNASGGNLGEIVTSTILQGAAQVLVTGSAKDVTSLSLTGGDWDVRAGLTILQGSAMSSMIGWISSVSATLPTLPNSGSLVRHDLAFSQGGVQQMAISDLRVTASAAATIYLSTQCTFTASCVAFGAITARRVR